MRVLMIGRKKSIAFEDLVKYWGDVVFASPPNILLRTYDLVIAQEPTLRIGLPAYLVAKICKAKLIVEVHGEYLENWLKGIQKHISFFILRRADFVRAVNTRIANQLYKIGIKKGVMVIPSVYIRTDILNPVKKHVERNKIVIYAGRFVFEKNLSLLINSFRYVVKEEPSAKLLLIGNGPEKIKLIKLIKDYRLTGSVTLIDRWMTLKELAFYYNEAAVFALTSFYEGGPRAVFEAGACGTPFVSTPVGILPELVSDGECGYFLDSLNPAEVAEKILLLLGDPALRQKMGENFRRIVFENFQWDKAIRRYAEAYLKCLKKVKTS